MAHLAWPVFAKGARISGEVPNDFSDMAVLSGFDVVGERLREVAYQAVSRADDLMERNPVAVFGIEAGESSERKEDGKMSRVKENLVEGAEGSQRRRSSKRSAPKEVALETPMPSASSEPTANDASPVADVPAAVPPAADSPQFASTRPPVGDPLFGLVDVPNEMKALAEHRFGTPLRMGTPRENGGPYRGEVFNTEHYLIQEVATRSVVFHRKDLMDFVSERL
jgi:putative DNA primase/helicase